MLYGCDLKITTDHDACFVGRFLSKNMSQILLGQNNIIVNFFSQAPFSEGKEAPGLCGPTHTQDMTYEMWFMEGEVLNIADYCFSTALDPPTPDFCCKGETILAVPCVMFHSVCLVRSAFILIFSSFLFCN
jgi:hypothetical protein